MRNTFPLLLLIFWEKLEVKSEFFKYHKCAHNVGVYNNITHEIGVYGKGVQISQKFISHLKRLVTHCSFVLRNSNNTRHHTKFSRHGALVPKICVHVVYWIGHCARIVTIYVAFHLGDTSIEHCIYFTTSPSGPARDTWAPRADQ
jgi:hypothetical protein